MALMELRWGRGVVLQLVDNTSFSNNVEMDSVVAINKQASECVWNSEMLIGSSPVSGTNLA